MLTRPPERSWVAGSILTTSARLAAPSEDWKECRWKSLVSLIESEEEAGDACRIIGPKPFREGRATDAAQFSRMGGRPGPTL